MKTRRDPEEGLEKWFEGNEGNLLCKSFHPFFFFLNVPRLTCQRFLLRVILIAMALEHLVMLVFSSVQEGEFVCMHKCLKPS